MRRDRGNQNRQIIEQDQYPKVGQCSPIGLRRILGLCEQVPDAWLAIRIPLEERNGGCQATSSSSSNSSGSSSSISANPGSSSDSAGAAGGVAAGVGISKRLAGFCGAGFAGSAGLAEGIF